MKPPDYWRHLPQIIIDILIGLMVVIAALTLWQWYQNGGGFEAIYVVIGITLTGLLWFRRRFAKQPPKPLTSTAVPSLPASESYASVPAFAPMRQQMNDLFSLDDMRSLSYDLGINYDNLAGQTLDGKIISLLIYTTQHNQLPALETKLNELRPHAKWSFPSPQSLTPDLQLDRNRKNYLNALKTTWIDGFLHQSLHK